MWELKVKKGNLITEARLGKFDVIIHGCNCFHQMGAGIAVDIKKTFPRAYTADKATPFGSKTKLGTLSIASYDKIDVVNAYTQYTYGRGMRLNYSALQSCLKGIKAKYSGKRIGMPKIGCGLAGGSWAIVKELIEIELVDEDVTVIYL